MWQRERERESMVALGVRWEAAGRERYKGGSLNLEVKGNMHDICFHTWKILCHLLIFSSHVYGHQGDKRLSRVSTGAVDEGSRPGPRVLPPSLPPSPPPLCLSLIVHSA